MFEEIFERPQVNPERAALLESEGITEQDVWETEDIRPAVRVLTPQITTEVPGMETALIFGDPISLGEELDFQQGYDNPYGFLGTCGLTSIANICQIAGMDVTEPQVVEYAAENGLCETADPKMGGGGVTVADDLKLLSHYGLESHCEFSDVAGFDRLAEAVEGGHGVIVGLNSGLLQERDWKVYSEDGTICANHAVCLTGTVYDPQSGELTGFYLCDSSGQHADSGKTYVPLEKMKECYLDIQGGFAVITDEPIRGI